MLADRSSQGLLCASPEGSRPAPRGTSERSGLAQGAPRPQSFFKVGFSAMQSGIPGDLDRGVGLPKQKGCLETIFSALNSSGPHKSSAEGWAWLITHCLRK